MDNFQTSKLSVYLAKRDHEILPDYPAAHLNFIMLGLLTAGDYLTLLFEMDYLQRSSNI